MAELDKEKSHRSLEPYFGAGVSGGHPIHPLFFPCVRTQSNPDRFMAAGPGSRVACTRSASRRDDYSAGRLSVAEDRPATRQP